MENIDATIEDEVGYIEIAREDMANALDSPTRDDMIEKLVDYKNNDDVKAVVFTGSGRSFSAGGDFKELREADYDPEMFIGLGDNWERLYRRMINLGKPTIAQVDGYAIGGGFNMLLYTDISVATESSRLGHPELQRGFFEWFSISRLPHMIGPRKSLELLLLGDYLTATEAHRLGLINRVVPDDEIDAEIAEILDKLRENSLPIMAKAKDAMWTSFEMQPESAFQYTKELARKSAYEDHEYPEGMNAFLEKRDPDWSS